MEKGRQPLWHKNAETMIGSYSILAALAGVLLTAVILDTQIPHLRAPVILFSASIILFILGIEKFGDALDEDDVDKFLAWLLAYNIGVITLFFGMAYFIIDHYQILYFWYWFIIVAAFASSLKWICDIYSLIFDNKEDYELYRNELLGKQTPKHQTDCLLWLHASIRKILGKSIGKKFSHENAYTRLGVSKIHGIGVFATRNIEKDTNLFTDDTSKMIWLNKSETDMLHLSKETKKLYEDFCVIKDGKYGCPENFNNLTVSWYLNEPQKGNRPNVYCDSNYDFFASRDIQEGEELTVDYSTYSQ